VGVRQPEAPHRLPRLMGAFRRVLRWRRRAHAFLEKYMLYLAIDKQKTLLGRLKIAYPAWISKREASALISKKIARRRKS